MATVAAFIAGALVGALAIWLILHERYDLSDRFKRISSDALQQSNASFLELAKTQLEGVAGTHLAPIKESLDLFDQQVRELEQARKYDKGELTKELQLLRQGGEQLRLETAALKTALRTPHVRGRWGEMQLRRALEMAGMIAHCDFVEQPTSTSDNGLLKPDVVVKLPGGKNVVVDAKVPLTALLDAADSGDEAEHEQHLQAFVRHVRDHVAKLAEKAYWQQFAPSPEFVIMFLPSESFYRYALEQDPRLLEMGPQQKVILASPTTLIALLLSAAAGWREQTLAESAREISEHGRELYERLATMGGHLAKLGGRLGKAVEAFNETLGSLEQRVLPAARRFPELGVSSKADLPALEPIEIAVRPLTAPELGAEHKPKLVPPAADAA